MPTADDFRALARSAPWRCTTAHFTRRGVGSPPVEAWLERPGRLTTRDERGTRRWVDNNEFGQPAPAVWIRDITPVTRPDGLVQLRPDDEDWTGPEGDHAERDDPMYENYHWVAMLDPRELGSGVDVSDVREVTHHGRRAWAARCVPNQEYGPRCGCCPLLWCEVSDRDEYGDPDDPAAWTPTATYPEAYDVVLDHATGFVVAITPVGETSRADLALDVEIHAAS